MSTHLAIAQADRVRLRHVLEHVSHYLPAQAPLEVFVHHNTLHAFQHLPFHDAISRAQTKLGVRGYLSEETYRGHLTSGGSPSPTSTPCSPGRASRTRRSPPGSRRSRPSPAWSPATASARPPRPTSTGRSSRTRPPPTFTRTCRSACAPPMVDATDAWLAPRLARQGDMGARGPRRQHRRQARVPHAGRRARGPARRQGPARGVRGPPRGRRRARAVDRVRRRVRPPRRRGLARGPPARVPPRAAARVQPRGHQRPRAPDPDPRVRRVPRPRPCRSGRCPTASTALPRVAVAVMLAGRSVRPAGWRGSACA
jgi:hypothetical protein